jgi:Uncharacterised nucleotidyltransferase
VVVPSHHGAVDRNTLAWLNCLADPIGKAPRPATDLPPESVEGLVEAAMYHSVLPAVVHGIRSDPRLAAAAEALPPVSNQLAGLAAKSLLLTHQGNRVVAALAAARIPATLVKGPVFARRLYADAALRSFTDIDVLVPAEMRGATHEIMAGLGFRLTEQEARASLDYHEDQWRGAGQGELLVEIQDNLVHAPSLRRMSLTYADLVEAGRGDPESATALLIVAAVHGAIGDQFESLRLAVDVCQAARGIAGPIDIEALARVTARNGTRLAILSALDLTGRLFSELACFDLAGKLGSAGVRRFFRTILGPKAVLRAQGPSRDRDSWRRKLLRESLKRASKVDPKTTY